MERNNRLVDLQFYPTQYAALATRGNEILAGGSKGGGKDLDLNTKVLTTEGWKTIGTVRVGDYVFNEQGLPTKVVAKSEIMRNRTFKIWFDKYTHIIAGESHDWVTWTDNERNTNYKRTPEYREHRRKQRAEKRAKGLQEKTKKTLRERPDLAERNASRDYELLDIIPPKIRSTLEIFETVKTSRGRANHTVQTTKPIQYEEKELLVDPYMLGVWLGDGGTGSGSFTGFDLPIEDTLISKGYDVSHKKEEDKNCYVFYVKGLITKLKEIGVAHNKHIPEIYKRGSVEQRIELVQGLLDTDGYVEENGSIEISLSHEPLARDLHEVLISLGIKVNIRQREAKLYGVRKKDRYRMVFSTDLKLFKLKRHLDRLTSNPDEHFKIRENWYITDVEEIEPVDTQCIQVDCESHMYLAGEHLIPTHNSFLLRWAALLYCMYIPGLNVYFFRKKYKDLLSNHLYGPEGYLSILEPFAKVGKVQINLSDNRIDFYHGDDRTSNIFLRHVQHDKDMENYRGIEAHVMIFDELTHFPKPVYNFLRTHVRLGGFKIDYEEVRKHLPFIEHDDYFPRILCGSNPGGIGHAWVKSEFIDPGLPNQVWQTPPEKGGMRRIYIPSKVTDNKKLLENDPGYIDRIKGMGGPMVKAFLDGDWNIDSGGALSDLWDENTHVIEPFIIPENATIMRSMDMGTFHPSAIVYTFVSNGELVQTYDGEELWFPPQSHIVIHEIYNWNGNENEGNRMAAPDIGKQIARFESQQPWMDNIRKGPADNQIFQNRGGSYQTTHDMLVEGYNEEMLKIAGEDPNFSWPVHEDRLFIRADQSASSRVTGLGLVRSYLKAATQGDGRKGLYFFNTCKHCMRTIPYLPRDESNPEDVDTKAEDHLYDVVRYNCLSQKGSFEQLDVLGI